MFYNMKNSETVKSMAEALGWEKKSRKTHIIAAESSQLNEGCKQHVLRCVLSVFCMFLNVFVTFLNLCFYSVPGFSVFLKVLRVFYSN